MRHAPLLTSRAGSVCAFPPKTEKVFMKKKSIQGVLFVLLAVGFYGLARAAMGDYGGLGWGTPMGSPYGSPYGSGMGFGSGLGGTPWWAEMLLAALSGALTGAFFSDKFRPFRKLLFIIAGILFAGFLILTFDPLRLGATFLISFSLVYKLLRDKILAEQSKPKAPLKLATFGTAEWATLEHLQSCKFLCDARGLFLGDFRNYDQQRPLYYTGDRHLLTVAPTRSGKGVSAIIPNLLTYNGSVLVIDPKGENARITAHQRRKGLGQTVHIVDPWGITGEPVSCFNPLDWLRPDDEDVNENAMMLADSIITHHAAGNADPFWDEEAKALLMGFILYVALDEREQKQRHLGRVRDILVSDTETLNNTLTIMFNHPNPIVSSTAARTASKDPKLRSNVFAALQSHMHFLDSPRIRASLARSDFRFEDLKTSKMSIYLVLPADRLDTFGRWLRLLVQQAITVNARNIEIKPEQPILFILDELPAIGRLKMVEQAYGLMAGFGMQLWGIVQDLSQLERIYDKGWETFIGNSGVLQYFGSRDQKTAEYFSKLCGVTTIEKLTISHAFAQGLSWAKSIVWGEHGSSSSSESESTTNTKSYNSDYVQRHLAYPDELMVLRNERQILLVENANPIPGDKVEWFNDPRFQELGISLEAPAQAAMPNLKPELIPVSATP
jgi:type IV secretion system protein VirD4